MADPKTWKRVRPLDVEKIKKAFPVPQPETETELEMDYTYCVMGAVGLYMKEKCPSHKDWIKKNEKKWKVTVGDHPGEKKCVVILQRLNPRLTDEQADDYASKITDLNDNGYFDDSWDTLREALIAKRDTSSDDE